MNLGKKDMAGYIDQTLLSPAATEEEVSAFCREAYGLGFAGVCVNPSFVALASGILRGSGVKVCSVVDFPFGAGGFDSKKEQAEAAVRHGAEELDFVIDLGLVKGGEWELLEKELTSLNRGIKEFSACLRAQTPERQKGGNESVPSVVTKLILETCLLSDDEIVSSCLCAKSAGFDFVKTSTGFAVIKDSSGRSLSNGATVEAVKLMRATVGSGMGVKASGGIRTAADAFAMIEAGADRIGTSSGIKILGEIPCG